jgi:hypothetical protein
MKEVHNKLKIEIGQVFKSLTVLEEIKNYTIPSGVRKRAFICECVCGNIKTITLECLRSGQKSCGCLNRVENIVRTEDYELRKEIRIRYYGIRARCNNINHLSYKNYGGRGVKVCKEWDNFENFYNWCIENNYSKELEVDRKDNDGDYCPENCRIVSKQVNTRNTRKSISIELIYEILEGKYKNISSYNISKIENHSRSTICRIRKRDYSKQLEEYKQNKILNGTETPLLGTSIKSN